MASDFFYLNGKRYNRIISNTDFERFKEILNTEDDDFLLSHDEEDDQIELCGNTKTNLNESDMSRNLNDRFSEIAGDDFDERMKKWMERFNNEKSSPPPSPKSSRERLSEFERKLNRKIIENSRKRQPFSPSGEKHYSQSEAEGFERKVKYLNAELNNLKDSNRAKTMKIEKLEKALRQSIDKHYDLEVKLRKKQKNEKIIEDASVSFKRVKDAIVKWFTS